MDLDLPPGVLLFFPVQFFGQSELPDADRLAGTRGSSGAIHFGDSFGGPRASLAGSTPHRAIDIMAPRGTPIFAALDGVVPPTWTVFNEVRPGVRRAVAIPGIGTPSSPPGNDGGNYVVIVDGAGRHHYYSHMEDRPLVGIGEHVSAGQLIGHAGSSGNARGTVHLHYQVTTRPAPGRPGLTFWNPYSNLASLAAGIGGRSRGRRVEISFADFLAAVQTRHGTEIIDPWTGRVTPAILHPWNVAF